jgi:hypothetical protein
MEPSSPRDVHRPMRRLNPHVLVALTGVAIILLLLAYVASTRNPDQDKLKDSQVTTAQPAALEKRCASASTYELIKRELFRRAAQVRGSDQSAYDRLSAYAAIRVENPVLESDNKDTGAVNCSGSLSLDLPPGVAAVGGRRTLMSDIDYTVQPAADGSGNVVLLRNADAVVTPLATLARLNQPAPAPAPSVPVETNTIEPQAPQPAAPIPQPMAPQSPLRPTCRATELRLREGSHARRGCDLFGSRSCGARPQHDGGICARRRRRFAG